MNAMSPSHVIVAPARLATVADRDALFDLLVEDHAENGLCSLSPPKLMGMIDRLLDLSTNTGFVLVVDGPNGLAASLGIAVSQLWYSEDWEMGDMWMYVRHGSRSGLFEVLRDSAINISDLWGIPVGLGIAGTKRLEAKMRLYRRRLTHIGGSFVHFPKTRPNVEAA